MVIGLRLDGRLICILIGRLMSDLGGRPFDEYGNATFCVFWVQIHLITSKHSTLLKNIFLNKSAFLINELILFWLCRIIMHV